MGKLSVFISYSNRDSDFCHQLARAFAQAGADTWYYEGDASPGALQDIVARQIAARPIFVLLLSPEGLASPWVLFEFTRAKMLQEQDPARIILPVIIRPVAEAKLWAFLAGMRRIDFTPDPEDMIRSILVALGLASNPLAIYSLEDLLGRGNASFTQWRNAEALPFFQVVTHLDPGHFWAWHNLGEVYRRLEEYDHAVDAFRHALALQSTNIWALIHLADAVYETGLECDDPKRFEEAEALFTEAADRYPENTWVWHDWGWCLFRVGDHTRAIELYNRALTADPNSKWAWHNRGKARLALGDKEYARQDFEHAHQLDDKIEIPSVD